MMFIVLATNTKLAVEREIELDTMIETDFSIIPYVSHAIIPMQYIIYIYKDIADVS